MRKTGKYEELLVRDNVTFTDELSLLCEWERRLAEPVDLMFPRVVLLYLRGLAVPALCLALKDCSLTVHTTTVSAVGQPTLSVVSVAYHC